MKRMLGVKIKTLVFTFYFLKQINIIVSVITVKKSLSNDFGVIYLIYKSYNMFSFKRCSREYNIFKKAKL